MSFTEQAIIFPCAVENLLGIVAVPEQSKSTGVLIIVGGPQVRVGSHRQFLLLSRSLAEAGYPVMRFDTRGMGDSTGELHDFEAINKDIAAAIDAFQTNHPSVERIVLWGLCDAVSALLGCNCGPSYRRLGITEPLGPFRSHVGQDTNKALLRSATPAG